MQVKYRNWFLQISFFLLKFVENFYVSPWFNLASASVISSHLINESSIIFDKFFSFLQLHLEGFQI